MARNIVSSLCGASSTSTTTTTSTSLESVLTITSTISAGTEISANSSGAGYSHSGDSSINFGASSAEFNDNQQIEINRNGVELVRGTEVNWVSSTSFSITSPMVAGEEVVVNIFSQ